MNLPSLTCVGSNFNQVEMGGLTVWFSYSVPIAFQTYDGPIVTRENEWGGTTGKHLNQLQADKKKRLLSDEFEEKLKSAMAWKEYTSIVPKAP